VAQKTGQSRSGSHINLGAGTAQPATDEAERLYKAYGDAVYQVQVIDLASDKKTSIGSGFQISKDGLIATNYHVVAEALQRSAGNRMEFLHDKGERGTLKILIADVVHDLAIVKMDKPGKTWLSLGTSKLPKGTKLFSLGNPHDIGFTIIEGTFNGLSKESFIDQIHFSGSLNPGMSGGPAIGHNGAVAGINVATSGNQISFLIPVEPLHRLVKEYSAQPADDFFSHLDAHIQQQLLASQDRNIGAMLKNKWDSVPFGPLMVPGRIHNVLKCWGGISHKEKDPFKSYFSMCSSQDRMFLDEGFDTSLISYRFNYITGKDTFNLQRFYNFYQGQFAAFPGEEFGNAREDNVTNFDCNSRFVDIAGHRWKSSFCARQYKKYPKIFDMHFTMAMVGAGKTGFIATMTVQGVSKDNALALAQKFMSEIKKPAEKKPS